MPAIEGYIGNCHLENSTVDRGVSRGHVELEELLFSMYPSIAALIVILY
jgi:hypothetical protein